MTAQQIAAEIRHMATRADLEIISAALRQQNAIIVAIAGDGFARGNVVTFTTKSGEMITGTVETVNRKTLTLRDCSNQRGEKTANWRVPPTLCHAAGSR